MEILDRAFERNFYRSLNSHLDTQPTAEHLPDTWQDPRSDSRYVALYGPGNDNSPLLFVLTYAMAAAFCGLVLYYQFTLLPKHRIERESLHQVQNKALDLRAQLFELFFLQQDFLNQELVAKLPPKDAAVNEFLDTVSETADDAFLAAEANETIQKSFDTTFQNFLELWQSVSQRALKGDPEGAKVAFLAEEPGLRASMLESVETQVQDLRTAFKATDAELSASQKQFSYFIFVAGFGFLLLFLREMATYFKFRRLLQRADVAAAAAPSVSENLVEFEAHGKAVQRIVERIVTEGEHKKDRIAELTRLVQPLIDFEAKYRAQLKSQTNANGDPRQLMGDFLNESHACMLKLWENLGHFSGTKDAQIISLADWQAERELGEAIAKLDASCRKVVAAGRPAETVSQPAAESHPEAVLPPSTETAAHIDDAELPKAG